MPISKCANCGADIDYAGKFCRRCGHPTDPSELTTRKLEEPSQFEAPTRSANSWPTSPAYLPPDALPPQVAATSGPSQKKTVLALAAIIGVLLIALSALGVFMFIRKSEAPRMAPSPAYVPETPDQPASPTPPSQPSIASGELIYPGARVTMEIPGGPKGKVLQLSTPDPTDKVIDWYLEKINPKRQVRTLGNAVITGDGVAVVITNEGSGTGIILTQK